VRILIVYGTMYGQTRKVVEFLAERLRQSAVVEVREAGAADDVDPADFDGTIVASSMEMGSYRPVVIKFARRHLAALDARPSVFVSVSLSAANRRHREAAAASLQKWLARFGRKSGWTPARVEHVGGALAFTHYCFIVRWIMVRFARYGGYDTDTARDHEYTDWEAVGRFADAFLASLGAGAPATA